MDLSLTASEQYWSNRSSALKELLLRMREREDWAIDSEGDVESWLVALGRALDDPQCMRRIAANPKDAVEFLGWLSSPRALMILDLLDDAHAGVAAQVVLEAEGLSHNPVYRVFVEGLEVLSRSKLLAHVFSPERMALVDCAVRAAKAGG